VKELRLAEAEQDKILGGNALKLFRLADVQRPSARGPAAIT
jgi:hypothetical protein